MQRSSESIASLAAALAKAQAELVNPEKSLTATIRSNDDKGGELTFRYAPLSSGLDIVRKALGQHEIATMQTTAVDQQAGLVNLTTVLAHSSGEWIASDWPVCAISETATPHRMGAALTYARRYALFTLVGIAGEDDLDAPDLVTPTQQAPPERVQGQDGYGRLNNGSRGSRQAKRVRSSPLAPTLGPEASAALRDRLIVALNELGGAEDAAGWAQRCLPEKNTLAAADARLVEDAFAAKLATLVEPVLSNSPASNRTELPALAQKRRRRKPESRRNAEAVNKSSLAFPEPRRIRDREHVRYVAERPCLICGRLPSDAHHVRFAQNRAFGRKVSDEFTVPLCRGHHREVHRCGDEDGWWQQIGIDALAAARVLWLETHPRPITAQDQI